VTSEEARDYEIRASGLRERIVPEIDRRSHVRDQARYALPAEGQPSIHARNRRPDHRREAWSAPRRVDRPHLDSPAGLKAVCEGLEPRHFRRHR